MVSRALINLFKNIAKPREFTFQGIIQPGRVRRRVRLATGVIRATATGKLSKKTKKDLIEEITDAILDSPFVQYFLEAEAERGGRLFP